MGFLKFSILTIVGAAIWCTVLAWLGGRVGDKLRVEGKDPLDPEALVAAVKHESHSSSASCCWSACSTSSG